MAADTSRLWAPWRMEYILRAEREERAKRARGEVSPRPKCLFCALKKPGGDRAHLVVTRRPRAFLMLNRFPYNPGHVMVAAVGHVGRLTELDAETWADVTALASLAERALEAEYRPHGFNIGVNLGRVAGAGFPGHFHLHVVPRWNGDTNYMPTVAETKVLPESLSRTWTRLTRALRALDGAKTPRSRGRAR